MKNQCQTFKKDFLTERFGEANAEKNECFPGQIPPKDMFSSEKNTFQNEEFGKSLLGPGIVFCFLSN